MTDPVFRTISINDPADPRLEPYRSLKGKQLEREGIFIAEGEKVVRSMLDARIKVVSCLTAADTVGRYKRILGEAVKRGADIYIADKALIEGVIGFRFHRGIMAVGRCPVKRTVAEALARPARGRGQLLVALNAINDPQNVGLIARNAAAFGADALIVDGATYDPYYRRAVRNSMGTIFGLTVCYEKDLAPSLRRLQKLGVRIIAAAPGGKSIDIADADLSGSICLVFGNEESGVAEDVLRIADVRARIPISKDVDSLNVAGASAVFLYETRRRARSPERIGARGRRA